MVFDLVSKQIIYFDILLRRNGSNNNRTGKYLIAKIIVDFSV
jgi:hypothetical protein